MLSFVRLVNGAVCIAISGASFFYQIGGVQKLGLIAG